MKELSNMPCLSSGFPFSQHTTPRGCVLAFEKHCSMGCKLKLKFGIHRDKLMEQFSLHFCDFFSWIMGAADFMDQMTVSSRSADAVLRNYPINMTNRDSTNERQHDHGGLRFLSVEATSNLWKKCSSERTKLRRTLFLSSASICPLPSRSPPAPGGDQYFCRSSFLVIRHMCCRSQLPLISWALERPG